jgi:hypothetical protein
MGVTQSHSLETPISAEDLHVPAVLFLPFPEKYPIQDGKASFNPRQDGQLEYKGGNLMRTLTVTVVAIFAIMSMPSLVGQDTDSHTKAAHDFLNAIRAKENFENAMKGVLASMKDEDVKAVAQQMLGDFGWDSINDDMARLYVEQFSESELKELAAFFNTPTGQKYARKIPLLTKRAKEIGIKCMSELVDKYLEMDEKAPDTPGNK